MYYNATAGTSFEKSVAPTMIIHSLILSQWCLHVCVKSQVIQLQQAPNVANESKHTYVFFSSIVFRI